MNKQGLFIIALLCSFSMLCAQAPIIISDTDGDISEVALPNSCDKRIITNVGTSLSDITLHPNGKMYGTRYSQQKMYEVDTTTGDLTEIIDFGSARPVGMTAAANGKVYVSEGDGTPSRLFEVDVTTNTFITKGLLADGSAGDLTWFNGELYNASENNKLVKIDIETPENSIVIGDFFGDIASDEIFSLVTNVFACDSSVTYGMTEDRQYFTINMATAQTTALCVGDGARIFGATSRDEFRASDTCLVQLDLDDDNSSGIFGNDFASNFNCETTSAPVADLDANIQSVNIIDSVTIQLTSGVLDGANEFLTIGSNTNINSNNNAASLLGVNNGSATIIHFESYLQTIEYSNTAASASLGDRVVTVTVYSNGESASAVTTITISGSVDAGNNGTLSLCSDEDPVNLVNSLTGSPQSDGTWSPTLESGNNTFNPAEDAAGIYTYLVTDGCLRDSATVTVTINTAVSAGENGTLALCSANDPIDLITALEGNPTTGGTWTPTLNSGTGVFNPATDAAGTYTYTVQGEGNCEDASAQVTVSFDGSVDAGSNGTLSLCSDDDSSVDLILSLEGNPQANGTWSPTLTSGTGVFDPTQDSEGTYTYLVTDGCVSDSATVVVTINRPPNAGTDGNLALCDTDAAIDLASNLGDAFDPNGTWSPALTSGTGVFDPSEDDAGNYTYTVIGIGNCADDAAIITVTVAACTGNVTLDLDDNNSSGASGNDFESTFDCESTSAPIADIDVAITSDELIDSVIIEFASGLLDVGFEVLESGTVANISVTNTTTTIVATNDGAATITNFETLISGLTYSNSANPETEGDRTITITVYSDGNSAAATSTIDVPNTQVNAGSDNSITISDDNTVDLFTLLGTADPNGSWSPALASGTGIFDPTQDAEGSYTYTVSNDCNSDDAIINVTIETPSDCKFESLFVPTGFTPNNDGQNDVYYINLLGSYDKLDFRIYNRWGEIVFETNDIAIGWDGQFNGDLQTTDAFGYFLQVECDDEVIQRKGSITVVR